MPSPIVKSFAKKTGKSTAQVERLWQQASDLARKMGRGEDFEYTVDTLKNMLGLDEATVQDIKSISFLESDFMSWNEFTKAQLIS